MSSPTERSDAEQLVAAALSRLAGEVGAEALADPDRLRALLLDELGGEAHRCRRELRLICDVAGEGIAARITHGPTLDHAVLAGEFAESTGLSLDSARWAIDTFAEAVQPGSAAASRSSDTDAATEPLVFDPETGEDSPPPSPSPAPPATVPPTAVAPVAAAGAAAAAGPPDVEPESGQQGSASPGLAETLPPAAPPPTGTPPAGTPPTETPPAPPPAFTGAAGAGDDERRRRLLAVAAVAAVVVIAGIVAVVLALTGDDGTSSVDSNDPGDGTSSTVTTIASSTTAVTTTAPTTAKPTTTTAPKPPATQKAADVAVLRQAIPPAMTGCAPVAVSGAVAGLKCALNGGQPVVDYGLFASNGAATAALQRQMAGVPNTKGVCGKSAAAGVDGWHYRIDVATQVGSMICRQVGNQAFISWNDGRVVANASLTGDEEAHHAIFDVWAADSLGPWGGRSTAQPRGACGAGESARVAP